MEDEIKEQLEHFIAYSKSWTIRLSDIKYILIMKFNKRSLNYPFIARRWFENYFSLLNRAGYGIYDKMKQELVLNLNNETVQILLEKYKVSYIEDKSVIENGLKEIELIDELIQTKPLNKGTKA